MKRRPNKRTRKSRKWSGAKWIRPERRLAIYDRDGWCCVYCGWSSDKNDDTGTLVSASISVSLVSRSTLNEYLNHLTLDHVLPVAAGGTHRAENLVTACHWCNSERKAQTTRRWYRVLRARGIDVRAVRRRIKRQARALTKEQRARGHELLDLRVQARNRVVYVAVVST